ncbi:hypothetical protein LCGC14_3003170, partial [marine sediment metagenome]
MLKHLKVKVGRLYINYFFWLALWLSIATLLYGSFIILSVKGESSNILANFGSFSGGMATVVAALVAVREFILFRHNQGVKEFREFFIKQVQPLPNFILEMADEAYLLFAKLDRKAKEDLKRPEVIHEIQELENKLKLFEDAEANYDYVLAGPGQDAGVIDIGGGYALAFRIESHNHPSAIEPYHGAATGISGIIRDILCMGVRPIALLD